MRCVCFLFFITIVAIPYLTHASIQAPENIQIIPLKLQLILLGIVASPLILFVIPLGRSTTIISLPIIMVVQFFFIKKVAGIAGFFDPGSFLLLIVEFLYLVSYISYHILRTVLTKLSHWKNRLLSLILAILFILFIVFASGFFIILFYPY